MQTGIQNKKSLHPSANRKTQGRNGSPSNGQHDPATLALDHHNNDQTMAISVTIDPDSLKGIENVHILECNSPETKLRMAQLERIAFQYYNMGSPRTDLLLHLIQLNFTRALMENTRILRLRADQLHDDAISPFNTAGPWQDDAVRALPKTLQPTVVQRCIPHHPWLDLLPDPQIRDNLILAGEFEEEAQLCLDMKGDGSTRSGKNGIIVWSDPWDPAGWEVTEPFVRSWGWVIRNCYDLAYSTNRWRAKRNEKPLFRMS